MSLLLLASSPLAFATTTWNNGSGGSWSTAANWSTNSVPDSTSEDCDFSALDITGNQTVTLDGSFSTGTLTFADANGADGTWTLAPGSGGALTIAGPIVVTNQTTNMGVVLAGTGGLSKTGAGILTLTKANTYSGNTVVNAGTVKLTPVRAPAAFRYYRFTVTANNGDGYNQIGELHFYNNGTWVQATAGSASGGGTGEQLWSNANDNKGANVSGFTKYGIGGVPYSVNYDFGTSQILTGYNWSTANDSTPARNPKRWVVYGSNDNSNWVVIDDRSGSDQAGPSSTYTWAGATGTYVTVDNSTNGGAANAYPIPGPLGGNLPATSNLQIASGATLDLNGAPQTIASLANSGGGGTINNSATTTPLTLVINPASGSTTFSGQINDSGTTGAISLTKSGAGTQVLGGANNYSGSTSINAGTLQLTTGGSISTKTLSISGGTFDLGGQSQTVANLLATGGTISNSAATDSTLTVSTATTTTGNIAAALTTPSTGKLNLVFNSTASSGTTGASAMSLSNAGNTFVGSVTVNGNGYNDGNDWHGGMLGINTDAALGDAGNSITLSNGGALCNMWSPASGGGWPSHAVFTLGAGRTITLAGTMGGTIRLGYGDTCTINSTITGTGRLSRTDSGNLILNAANTFTGDTLVMGGTLTLGNALALQYSALDRDYTGGTFSFGSLTSAKLGGLKGVANLTIPSGGTLTLGSSASNGYFGILGGGDSNSGLTKTGTGTQQLAGANTYAGTTTVNNGTLLVAGGSIANGPVTVNGGTLQVLGGTVGSGGVAVASGTLNVQNFTAPASPQAYRYIRFQMNATQGGGTNNLQMSELAFYTSGSNNTNGARLFPVSVSGGGTWNAGANESPTSLVDNNVNTKWDYNSSTYPEALTFDFGSPQIFTGYDWATANDSTPARNPKDWQVFGSNDGGTWTLLDTRTNSGATPTTTFTWAPGWTFPALANVGSTVYGAVTVGSGGTLTGDGTVAGAVTVNSNGALSPGLSTGVGTLTISNTLTLNSGSTSNFRISKTGGTPAGDKVSGLTGVAYDGTLNVTNVTSDSTPLAYGDKFTLFTLGTGTYGGSYATLNLPTPPAGLKWDASALASDGSIQLIYANQVASPTFNPPGGGYVGAQNVTITCADADSTVYYTTDGSTPTTGSSHGDPGSASATVSVGVPTASVTIKAFATKAGSADSAVVAAAYSTVITPTWINDAGGNWSTASNWSYNVVANGVGATADFGTLSLPANTTVTLDASKTAGTLLFDDPNHHNWTIATGGGTLTLAVSSGSPTIAVNNPNITATINPVIAGTNGLDKTGDGTLTLGGANTFTGDTKVTGGSLVLANPLALQNSTLDYSAYGGTLSFGSLTAATLGGLKGNQALTTTVTLSVGNDNESTEYAGLLSGGGGLTKVGTGTLALLAANTYAGATGVNAGTLQLGAGGQIPSTSLVISGGAFDLNGQNQGITVLSATGGTLANTAATDSTLTVVTPAGIGGNCAALLATPSTGQLNLVFYSSVTTGSNSAEALDNPANSFTGSVTVVGNGYFDGEDWHGGMLGINGDGSLGNPANPITLTNGGVLCNLLSPNSGGGGWPRHAAFTLGADRTLHLAGTGGVIRLGYNETCTINSVITGEGGLAKTDNGALILGGSVSNSYAGTTTLGGNGKILLAKTGGAIAIPGNINISSTAWNGNAMGIVLAADEQIADTSVITWTSGGYGGTLRLNGHSETIGGLVCTASGLDPVVENRGYTDTASYGTGTLIINTVGSNSYTYNGNFRDMDAGTGSGPIALVKAGTGTQILSGSMACTGTTSVNEGTLVINTTSSASSTTVANGATLQGTGTLNNTLTINAGGTLAPGNSAGTFTAGATTLAGTYLCEIDGATADRLTVNGDLDLTGSTLQITEITPATADSYVIASYTGSLTGTFSVPSPLPGYSVQYDSGAKQIKLVKSGYSAWATTNGLSGNAAADFDNDGLADGVEYVLGTSPTTGNTGGPAASLVGGDLVFTFTRDHASMTSDVSVDIEVGTALDTWPAVYHVGADTGSSTSGVTVTDNGTNDTITLTVTRAPDEEKFARLRVTVTP